MTVAVKARHGDRVHALKTWDVLGCAAPMAAGKGVMVLTDLPVNCPRGCGAVHSDPDGMPHYTDEPAPVTLQFPNFPPIKGAGPVITEQPTPALVAERDRRAREQAEEDADADEMSAEFDRAAATPAPVTAPVGTSRGTYATHGKPSRVMYYGREKDPYGDGRGYPVTLSYSDRVIMVQPDDGDPGHADMFGPNVKFWAAWDVFLATPQDLD